MIQCVELETYLQNYLEVDAFQDYAPNGLQIEGKASIGRICTAVTASQDVIDAACAYQADALLVHHGYFWKGEDPTLRGMKRARIAKLLKHDINLLAYHLPIDCHKTLGNNACIAKKLELKHVQSHAAGKTPDLLWSGELTKPILDVQAFTQQLTRVFDRVPQVIAAAHSNKAIRKIAFCSGGAQDYLADAAALGADAYISGEISERTYYQAKELDIHYFACGHHATERDGIHALGKHLAEQFALEHRFIDSDNPV
ncbi:MAG: Nif3-like dinuclear metal center hexameric protein [Legionellaceae bacterium]|nr:Nif3-like dinuclear metal center hexameric protein [Legionellaceae bacterium]